MKVFIFEGLEQVSSNYHTGGGLVVIANDEDHLRKLIEEQTTIKIEVADWKTVSCYELFGDAEPKIFIFPDAGCC